MEPMITRIRKIVFYLFRKLIPLGWIDAAIREQRSNSQKANCTLGANSVLHPDARVINFQDAPGQISIGEHSIIRGELFISRYGGKITVGDYTFIGESSRIWSGEEIRIGNHVQISHGVSIFDTNTHSLDFLERQREYEEILTYGYIRHKGNIVTAPVLIEDHAWISFHVTILKGVTIGRGAIVAANSVVTKDVEPFTLVAGNPARIIRTLN